MESGEKHGLREEANAVGVGMIPRGFHSVGMSYFQGQRGRVGHLRWRGPPEEGSEGAKEQGVAEESR